MQTVQAQHAEYAQASISLHSMDNPRLSSTAKLVHIYAMTRCPHKNNGELWDFSATDLCNRLGICDSTRKKAMAELEAEGYLKRVCEQGKGKRWEWTLTIYRNPPTQPALTGTDSTSLSETSPEVKIPPTETPAEVSDTDSSQRSQIVSPPQVKLPPAVESPIKKERIKIIPEVPEVPDTGERDMNNCERVVTSPKEPKPGNALTRFSLEEIQKKPYSETRTCPDKATLGGYLYGLSWPRLKKAILVILNEQTGLPRPTFGYWARAAETWERKYSHSGFPTNVLVNHMVHWVKDENNPKRFDVGAFNLSLPELEQDWRDAQEGMAVSVG